MVCFRHIMVYTQHKGGDSAYDDDNNNNNNYRIK